MVKRQTLNKNDYLETILLTILQNCSIIHLLKPGMEEAKILEEHQSNCFINQDKNEIFAYQNESSLLQAILEIGERDKHYSIEMELFEKPVAYFLHLGKLQEMLEVIKDFNGWSWNISKDEPSGQETKICYLNLVDLVGIETMIKMENEPKCIEFLFQKLSQLYGETLAKEFFTCFLQNVLRIYAKKEESYCKRLQEEEKKWEKELKEIQNKPEYLEKLTKEKIKINSRIGEIDLTLNNNERLKKSYTETNKELPMEKKHFSVSTYAESLEEERKQLLEKRVEINQLFEPEKFIAKREWIQERESFFREMDLKNFQEEKCLEKLQLIFWKLYRIKIQKTEEKKEIVNQIFELRYYFIQAKERKLFENQKEEQDKIKQEILKKAIQMKVCNSISKSEKQNEKILPVLFDSKIVNLEKMEISIEEEETATKIEIYDEKVLENTVTIEKIGWNEKNKKRRKIFD